MTYCRDVWAPMTEHAIGHADGLQWSGPWTLLLYLRILCFCTSFFLQQIFLHRVEYVPEPSQVRARPVNLSTPLAAREFAVGAGGSRLEQVSDLFARH